MKVLSLTWDKAVVLQADLVGFSSMASTFAKDGPVGAEKLSTMLEQFFATIIGVVEDRGGLVTGFAGDAVIAIWPGTGHEDRVHSAARDAHAALPEGLVCRISIATGPAGIDRFLQTDDGSEMWLATGAATRLAAALNSDARPGATVSGKIDDEAPARGEDHSALLVPRHDRTPLTTSWQAHSGAAMGPAFRHLTVLSCDLRGGASGDYSPSADPDATETARRLQRVIAHVAPWGGVPVNMVSEDKGIVLHVVFGLPPLGPAGREIRALRAAAALAEDETITCPTGVVDGRMFISPHGTATTRTVSAMGWPSSLATRLMQISDGLPVVDAATAGRARGDLLFDPPRAIEVKGWDRPVEVTSLRETGRGDIVGETTPLAGWLEPGAGRAGQPLILAGPRGIGRTHQLRALRATARARGWRTLSPALRPDGNQVPYDAIARLLQVLHRETDALSELDAKMRDALVPLTGLRDFLGAMDPRDDLDGTPGEVQRQRLEDAVAALFGMHADAAAPLLVIVDDGQHLDRSSRALLDRLARDGTRVVVALRTDDRLRAPPDAHVLETLDVAQCARIICDLAGAPGIEPDATAILHARSGGNPLFLRELVRDLLDSGRLTQSGGILRLPTAEPADPERRSLAPATLRELTEGRLDRCKPEERAVLSHAAVLGSRFTQAELAGFPAMASLDMAAALQSLAVRDFLRGHTDGAYSFRDDVTREVAYDTLPFAARRALHLHLAEACDPAELADAARHWAGADRPDQAFGCHELLAQRATALFAHDEAIAHAAQARLIAEGANLAVSSERRAHLLMTEGTAALEAVELRMAEARLNDLLDQIGRPQPRNAVSQALHVLPALSRQGMHRLRGGPRIRDIRHGAMASTAHKNLAEIAYFEGRLGEVLLHTLHSLNIAERIGLTGEMVAGYSALSIGFETSGLARVADFYASRAQQTARDGGDPHDIAFSSLVALVLYSGRADWAAADAAAADAMAGYSALGAGGRWRQSVATLVHSRLARGSLKPDDPELATLEAAIESRTSAQIRVWVKTARIGAALTNGLAVPRETHEALAALIGHPQLNAADELLALCTLSVADLVTGDRHRAWTRARDALALARKQPPAAWHLCNALRWLCCATALLEDDALARRARQVMAQFARKMPVAKAAVAFHGGLGARSVAKRTALHRQAAKLARHGRLMDDAAVFDRIRTETHSRFSDSKGPQGTL